MKHKIIIILFSALAIFTASLSSYAVIKPSKSINYNYSGSFKTGTVNLTIALKDRQLYVSKFIIKTDKCTLTSHPNAKLNTGISINFATFGWNTKKGPTINGLITTVPATYLKSYIQWTGLKAKLKCAIPKKANIKLIAG